MIYAVVWWNMKPKAKLLISTFRFLTTKICMIILLQTFKDFSSNLFHLYENIFIFYLKGRSIVFFGKD